MQMMSEVSTATAYATAVTTILLGTAAGGTFTVLAYSVPKYAKPFLSAALFVTAMLYVGLALAGGAGPAWLTVEIVGVLVYGSASLRGLRGSAWWIVAGWALHPIWDIAHHVAHTGHAFVPSWYAMACLGFDIAVAAVIASRTWHGATALSQSLPRWVPQSLLQSLPQWVRL